MTALQLAVWQETRHLPSGPRVTSIWRKAAPTEVAYVCYYDGVFTGMPVPPNRSGQKPEPYQRIALIVDAKGRAELDSAGPAANLRIVDPARP